MKTDNIYNVLSDYLKRNHGNSTNEVICRYMIEHFLEIPEMSVNEIAEACYTSHPSIIRFTKEIGFEGISDFKYAILNYIDEIREKHNRVSFPVSVLSQEKIESSLRSWLSDQDEYILSSIRHFEREKIFSLCKEIHDYEKILLAGAGLSAVVLELFRILLARCGKVVNNIGTEFDVLENYKKDDTVLIVLSMYGMFLKEGKRNGEITKIKKLIKEHCHSSWLFTLKKDVDSITDEMILMNPEEAEYDLSLNGTIVFFELIAESYQQIYTN